MSSNLTNLDWLKEDPFFKKHFPFKTLEEHLRLDSDAVDQYVENAIRHATSNSPQFMNNNGTKLQYEHMDTHNHLITKVRIPKRVHPENIWIQLNRTQLKINGLNDDQSQIITLPTPINPDQSKATFKQGSLQVKMPKISTGRFKDVHIRFL